MHATAVARGARGSLILLQLLREGRATTSRSQTRPGTRGMDGMSTAQFQEFMRQAHRTATEEVRRAYMQGGMAMHNYYEQTGQREPTGDPQALGPAIRATPAQGSGTLPQRPAALPLTNAAVGQTPASSSRGPPGVAYVDPSDPQTLFLAEPPIGAGRWFVDRWGLHRQFRAGLWS